MENRIISCGILGNTGDHRTLGKRKFGNILSKITLCSGLHAQCIASKVNGIQIILEDPIFVINFLFKFDGNIHLLNLTLYLTLHFFKLGDFTFVLIRPLFGQYIVLDQLLRNGTCTLTEIHRLDVGYQCTCDTFEINSIMFIETLILNRYDRMLQILRNFIQRYILTVRSFRNKCCDLTSVTCQNRC